VTSVSRENVPQRHPENALKAGIGVTCDKFGKPSQLSMFPGHGTYWTRNPSMVIGSSCKPIGHNYIDGHTQ